MPAPEPIVGATVRFLTAHEPFACMASGDLRFLAERLRLAYFAAGSIVLEWQPDGAGRPPGDLPLHIIERGHVRTVDAAGGELVLGPGECFPLAPAPTGAVTSGAARARSVRGAAAPDSAGAGRYAAAEDVFCYQLAGVDAALLRVRSAPFADFCARSLAALERASLRQVHGEFGQRAIEQQTLLQPLKSLLRRPAVHCEAGTPLATALVLMRDAGVGTIAVVGPAGEPAGVFTLTDLMTRVVLAGVPLSAPVAGVMTARPAALDEEATAQEALALMAAEGFHQLMVTRAGRLVGVVSERDLFALQRVSMRYVLQAVRAARDVAALGHAAEGIAMLADNLIAQGAAAEPLTRTVAALNDALARRLFELLAPRFRLDGIRWCWLSLGSEGRQEQTIATDQDNAIVFDAGADADAARLAALRTPLLEFAHGANEALATLGFPLCPGNIMAGNPDCCRSLPEWQARFADWIREPVPEALLHANIFFDFRALAGDLGLAQQLRDWLLPLSSASRLFQRLLTTNALAAEPPLGVVRSFRTDSGEHEGTIDLKTHGARIFVDAARAFALAFGIAATGTATRLRLAGRRLGLDELSIAATVDAFHFVQLLRLRAQLAGGSGGAALVHRNRIDPYALNALDQRLLKEALRQARSLQRLLEQSLGQ